MTMLSFEERFPPEEVARYRAAGFWSDDVLADLLDQAAAARPDALFVGDPRTTYTYVEVRDRAYRLAAGLASLGVGRGDRVCVQLPNIADAAVTYFAVARLGAVFVPRMMIYRDHEVRDAIHRTDSVALVVGSPFRGFDHPGMAMRLKRECPSLRSVVVHGDAPDGAIDFESLCGGDPYDGPPPAADDFHIILFTSGTTAQPKGIVHTWNTYVGAARGMVANLRLTAADVCLMPSPVMHNTGLLAGVVTPLVARGATVLQPVWQPEQALELIERFGVTFTTGATTFLTMMIDAFDPGKHDISSLRQFGCGGAPVPGVVVRQAIDVLGCRIQTIYGQSESSLQTLTDLDDPVEVVASSDGKAVAGTEVVILDDDGREVPRGSEGEICSRGPGVMFSYWRDRDRTVESFTDGWFRSGDLGRMDERGYIRVTGRKKDLIIRGGHNISPAEVEALILEHPSVVDVAVVGMPDRVLGERMCAFVVAAAGATLTLADVTTFLREQQIAVQKLPERLELREELPHNATGKVEKFKLREEIAAMVADGQ
jgi:non-ribosomal peptide synthetase component E (peptide arylation enzyme)